MNIQDIFSLMDRFENSSLSSMEVEIGEFRLALKKGMESTERIIQSPAVVETGTPVGEQVVCGSKLTEIRAPFVGTFYQAASPDKKPFVKLGQEVKKGDVIGIVEAMKLMNEIVAPQDGVIESIQVEDGAMVEYNQVLMTLK